MAAGSPEPPFVLVSITMQVGSGKRSHGILLVSKTYIGQQGVEITHHRVIRLRFALSGLFPCF